VAADPWSPPTYGCGMQRLSVAGVGVIALLVGVLWILQGTDVVGGSAMSGHGQWTVIGLVLVVVGAALLAFAGTRMDRRG
jgi:hypothetical protein